MYAPLAQDARWNYIDRMNFPEGHPRPYIRDGVSGLPREEQREILTKAGVPMGQLFEDKLSRRQVKAQRPDDLKDRADLVLPTTRTTTEVIYVAAFRVLGWNMADIADTLAKAARRNVTHVVAVQARRILPLSRSDADIMDALVEIDAERRRAAYERQLAQGREVTQRRRSAKWERARKIAEPLWIMEPDDPGWMKGEDVAFKVGYSVRTLHKRLGTREDARYAAKEKALRNTGRIQDA
jgi:hypothetical protein